MPTFKPRTLLIGAAMLAIAGSAAAQDVQTGINSWQAGDYPAAVAIWRPLADRGDADAQFNLGQAYRLGRGVSQNLNLAEQWFERAARQRHEQAGASLGLLLFQNGRAREAMPWLQAAAGRGDPRAQYVFGTALFNGDIVRRDLPRAYAMMRAAAGQGFPQAQQQLTEMERQLSPEDRRRGDQIAAEIGAGSPPPTQVASNDPPRANPPRRDPPRANPPRTTPPRQQPPAATPPSPPRTAQGPGVSYAPPPEQGYPVGPAVEEPHRDPPRARPQPVTQPPRPRPERPVQAQRPQPQRPAPQPATGSWRVQVGAFSSDAAARRQWATLRGRFAALRDLSVSFQRAGPVTRIRAGGFANRATADRVCASVRAGGGACIPVSS